MSNVFREGLREAGLRNVQDLPRLRVRDAGQEDDRLDDRSVGRTGDNQDDGLDCLCAAAAGNTRGWTGTVIARLAVGGCARFREHETGHTRHIEDEESYDEHKDEPV